MSESRPLMDSAEELLTPGEVARMFRVDPKTVARWEKDGKIFSVKTLGGHRRYPLSKLAALRSAASPRQHIVQALDNIRALAVETGADLEADLIADLLTTLRKSP